ncbi:HAD family hydrolase [Phocicoccus pinnipedialis]|uniref:Haloacid dehalogenase-like hydrolase n=1 Tax=Phocicoccus pinnipedialis TaxID=110845 RepID=A0A6V7R5X2_9BACL|nr:HAD-IB family phosphatase [Jeotgalicoccus pinnipedialis]MBP1939790.1 HAD superfamily phosphoserine phosphatase-like hydrolase [Jeotgalicoccus pinnipedialis]CAD2072418.1 haloacid dehalogenase-like hydrolase [Jeotgalicoccus pinnipedialis]
MRIALFDFDGTIYPHETFETLRLHMRDNPKYKKYYKHFVVRFAPSYFGYKLRLVPKLKMQFKALESYVHAFKGMSKEDLEDFFKIVAEDMRKELREEILERIDELRNNDYYTILISGAFTPLLEALFPNKFDHIIGSTVNYENNKVDTKQPFKRVFGTKKIELIRTHFKGKNVDWHNSQAYSDSLSDLSMLNLVGEPVAVYPDNSLTKIAEANNWEIISKNK